MSYDYRPRPRIYNDREWEEMFVGGSEVFEKETYHNLDASIAFFTKAYSTSREWSLPCPAGALSTCSVCVIQMAIS